MSIETKVEDNTETSVASSIARGEINVENKADRDKIRAHNDYSDEELMVVICCVCYAFKPKNGEAWKSINNRNIEIRKKITKSMKIYNLLSHGYCPPCGKEEFRKIEELYLNPTNIF